MNFRTSGQLLLTAMIVLLTPATLPAQPDTEGIHERSSFSISNDYSNMKISKFSVIYLSEDHMLYNLMNRAVYDSPVHDFNINPTGASIAVVNKNAKNIVIVSNREKNVILATIK
mgnify:FL=1